MYISYRNSLKKVQMGDKIVRIKLGKKMYIVYLNGDVVEILVNF